MSIVELILAIASVLISAFALFASAYAALTISRGRDKAYRQKYYEFLRHKERVEQRIREARDQST